MTDTISSAIFREHWQIPPENKGDFMTAKRVLLIGGCGSMGSYLTPELLKLGYQVDIASNVRGDIEHPNLRYLITDARDIKNQKALLENHYDGVIDFLDYYYDDYLKRYRNFLENTGHYVYLSSYRAYYEAPGLTTEESPFQKDVHPDAQFRNSDDYSIYKAQNEETLRASGFENWSIVRPSIVFSRLSLPLVSLGAWSIWNRAMDGKPTLIPDCAVGIDATCTWSGDLAKYFSRLLFNPKCFCEAYNFATSEYRPWGDWAKMYKEMLGLETWTIGIDEFEKIYWNRAKWAVRQLHYDRLFNRRMDNSKILRDTGLTAADITPVEKALEYEFSRLDRSYRFPGGEEVNEAMDKYLANDGIIIRKL